MFVTLQLLLSNIQKIFFERLLLLTNTVPATVDNMMIHNYRNKYHHLNVPILFHTLSLLYLANL